MILKGCLSFILLTFVFLLAIVVRFYQLGSVPVGFHRDEASLGYNAYSILKTGRDIAGHFLPVHLQSFLYSPAGYSYLSIPFIFLFGLNEFAVRFASAFFGSVTVLIVYFLTTYLFKENKLNKSLGILSSFLFAISPWHINLSRVATENVIVVFFISVGVLLYFIWLRKKNDYLIVLAFVFFVLSLATYQAPRAFLPLFIPFLLFLFRPKLNAKNLILVVGMFILTIIFPIFFVLSSPKLSQRIHMLSILQFPQTQLVLDEQIREDGVNGGSPLQTRIFHNKVINYSSTFLVNYFQHFSYDFLFTDYGLPDRYRVPQMGLLYLFELPLLIFGIWKLFSADKKLGFFLVGWILLAPVGSAFTFDDVPNLQRTLIVFPALSIIEGFGALQFLKLLQERSVFKFAFPIVLVVVGYSFLYYLHQYYVHQIYHRPWFRQEGYKTLVRDINQMGSQYKKVIITDEESDPAIFFLFYNKYDPSLIQAELRRNMSDTFGKIPIRNYEFVNLKCPLYEIYSTNPLNNKLKVTLVEKKDTLYVDHGDCKITSTDARVIKDIRRSDDTVVFKILIINKDTNLQK